MNYRSSVSRLGRSGYSDILLDRLSMSLLREISCAFMVFYVVFWGNISAISSATFLQQIPNEITNVILLLWLYG